ncbi:MAG: hypothetical protein ACKVH8_22820 [Pirellulales bacterium]
MNAQPQMDFPVVILAIVCLTGIACVMTMVGLALAKKWWALLFLSGMGMLGVFGLIVVSLFLVRTTSSQHIVYDEARAVQHEMLSGDQQSGVIPQEAFDEGSQSSLIIEGKVSSASSATTADATVTKSKENPKKNNETDSTLELESSPSDTSSSKETSESTDVDTVETDTQEEESTEEPISKIIPEGRPDWVDQGYYEKDGVQYVSVSSGPYNRESDCKRFLAEEIDKVVNEMIDESLGTPSASQRFRLDKAHLEDFIVIDTYKEKLQNKIGPMNQWHAHLQFNGQFDVHMAAIWKDVQRTNRLYTVAVIFGSLLISLGVAYGILKTHLATDGKYPGRIQF